MKKTDKFRNPFLLGAGVLLLGLIGVETYSYNRYGFFAHPISVVTFNSPHLEKTLKGLQTMFFPLLLVQMEKPLLVVVVKTPSKFGELHHDK